MYNSELGVKKMAVGHRLSEHSHMMERNQNFNRESGEAGLCQLGGRRVRVGLGPESGVGVWVRRLVPICTSAIFWSSQVGCGMVCSA